MSRTAIAVRWLGVFDVTLDRVKELVHDSRADYVDLEIAGRFAHMLQQFYQEIERDYAKDNKTGPAG